MIALKVDELKTVKTYYCKDILTYIYMYIHTPTVTLIL